MNLSINIYLKIRKNYRNLIFIRIAISMLFHEYKKIFSQTLEIKFYNCELLFNAI